MLEPDVKMRPRKVHLFKDSLKDPFKQDNPPSNVEELNHPTTLIVAEEDSFNSEPVPSQQSHLHNRRTFYIK